jgi:xylulokinase
MQMGDALLGLDLGTSGIKVAVVDAGGQVLGSSSATYVVRAPHPGWAESDPSEWWQATRFAVAEALRAAGARIVGIGVVGQMHGVVLSDEKGGALGKAILWPDMRASAEVASFCDLPTEMRHRLANPISAGMAGPVLLWLARHEPDLLARARWALQPKDWLRFQLTHAAVSEPSDASGTLLYDLFADRWAYEVVDYLKLPRRLLPPLVESGERAGLLASTVADEFLLPRGLPVAAGASDTAAAALGAGLLEPGRVQLTVGTGAQLVAPLLSLARGHDATTHLYRAAAAGHWYAMAAIQNAGLAIEWALRNFGASWQEAYRALEVVAPGAEQPCFLPYITGERQDPQLTGAWADLRLHHRREHLLRAVLEGVAFAVRTAAEALTDAGIEVSNIVLAGGGSTEPAWRQLLADVLGRPLHVMPTYSASARGAALLGGVAAGVFGDVPATLAVAPKPMSTVRPRDKSAYEASYERFCELTKHLPAGRDVLAGQHARATPRALP